VLGEFGAAVAMAAKIAAGKMKSMLVCMAGKIVEERRSERA
jgi:hypothetical protein